MMTFIFCVQRMQKAIGRHEAEVQRLMHQIDKAADVLQQREDTTQVNIAEPLCD